MVDFLDTMADNLDEGLLPGDEREVSDERLGTVKVQYTTLSSEVVTSKEPGAATFDPGEALAGQFSKTRKCGQGKTCRGVVLKLIQYKKDLISVDENKQDSGVEVDGSKVRYSCPEFSAKVEKRKRKKGRKGREKVVFLEPEPSYSRGELTLVF